MGHISVNHLLDKQEANQVPSDREETMTDLADYYDHRHYHNPRSTSRQMMAYRGNGKRFCSNKREESARYIGPLGDWFSEISRA
jgi:hypothetical protein